MAETLDHNGTLNLYDVRSLRLGDEGSRFSRASSEKTECEATYAQNRWRRELRKKVLSLELHGGDERNDSNKMVSFNLKAWTVPGMITVAIFMINVTVGVTTTH